MSSANRTEVRYIAESTWGTTPTTPTLKYLRCTGESLNANINNVVSEEIRGDRNQSEMIQVGSGAGGDVNVELSPTSFNDMMEAAMCSTWVVDGVDTDKFTLVNGVLERSFTLQKKLADITQLFNFTGSRVNTLSLAVAPDAIVTGAIGFMSKSGARTASQFGSATLGDALTTVPFNGAAGVTVNTVDAGAIPGGLMNFTLNINNNRRVQQVVGSIEAKGIAAGKFEVSGDFETYFEDGTLYDKFATGAAFALQIKMVSGTNEVWIDIPKGKYNTAEVVAQGTDTDVMLKATYTALYDSTTLGSIKITRNGPL
jgi:hypothetical protein